MIYILGLNFTFQQLQARPSSVNFTFNYVWCFTCWLLQQTLKQNQSKAISTLQTIVLLIWWCVLFERFHCVQPMTSFVNHHLELHVGTRVHVYRLQMQFRCLLTKSKCACMLNNCINKVTRHGADNTTCGFTKTGSGSLTHRSRGKHYL